MGISLRRWRGWMPAGRISELIALTKKCLAAEAIDRPKDAQEVADGLSAYLDGVQERLQTAERERAVALAREVEERKRRKVQLALAASVLAMMLGVGAFAFWRTSRPSSYVSATPAIPRPWPPS